MVVLETDEVEVGVVMFEDPVAMPDEKTENPVEAPEETPGVGTVELAGPIGITDGEPKTIGADLGGPLIGMTGGAVAVNDVKLVDPPGAFEAELETTAVALEGEEIPGETLEAGAVELIETTGAPEEPTVPEVVAEPGDALEIGRGDLRIALIEGKGTVAVLLGDNGTTVLDGAMPLGVGTVVAFTGEGSIINVVVRISKAVPEMVPSK